VPAVSFAPRLIESDVPADPEGVALVLHGGAARRNPSAVRPTQLSVVRMVPIAGRISRVGTGRLAVYRLLNSERGWAQDRSPVDDATWALDEIARRHGEALPTALVGHSLGGRAALMAAHHEAVRSVVALAPWVYPTDDPPGLAGRRVLVVHGDRDRIALRDRAVEVARTIGRSTEVSFVTVRGGKHAMLRHRDRFDGLAASFVGATLLGLPADGVLARAASGRPVEV
jgi:pimeloyl-ACP methyl ester carboxylesterase